MQIKTSTTSPIRVDFVADGTLGLTFAPGKVGGSQVGNYRWDRDLDIDLRRLRDEYDVDHLVTLLEPHELEYLQIPGLRESVSDHGMRSHWFPIPDGGVPADQAAFADTVDAIEAWMAEGSRVVVHCRGGLGRAGTVAACVLVALGRDPDDAVAEVRKARPGAIETSAQERFVFAFAKQWRDNHDEA